MEISRNRILEWRMRALLPPYPRYELDHGTRDEDEAIPLGLEIIEADDALRVFLLALVINRRSHHLKKALEKIAHLQELVEAYQPHLDPEQS